jgi:hypothetical protein
MTIWEVTEADHEAGEKTGSVELRSGRVIEVTLHALPLRKFLAVQVEQKPEDIPWEILKRSLVASAEVVPGELLDKMEPTSAMALLDAALALAIGDTAQKKMQAEARSRIREELGRIGERPASASVAPDLAIAASGVSPG